MDYYKNNILGNIPPWAGAVAGLYAKSGQVLYGVGGWVRDKLSGRDAFDLDVTGTLLPERLFELFADVPWVSLKERNSRLGTLSISLEWEDGHYEMEYTPFRSETYAPGGTHRPREVFFGVGLQADAARRDFTVNAIYLDLITGKIHDPTGGLDDLRNNLLRTCRAPQLTFSEDGLRLARMARFAAAYDMVIDAETWQAAKQAAPQIDDIVPERLWDELNRIILPSGQPRLPDMRIVRGLDLLWDMGVMERIIPGFAKCAGFEQSSEYHQYDVLRHCFITCANAKKHQALRWAALLHDIAKPTVYSAQGNMYGHERVGAEMAREILCALRTPMKLNAQICALIQNHMCDLNANTSVTKLRRFFVKLGRENAQLLIDLRRADCFGSKEGITGDPARRMQEIYDTITHDGTPFSLEQLEVDGRTLAQTMDRPPGKWIGDVLEELLLWCVDHPKKNKRETLLAKARYLAAKGENNADDN